MKPVAITLPVAAAVLLLGCGSDESADESEGSIGPQFWLYDTTGYEIVDHDVVSGFGGRWISVRYKAQEPGIETREAKISEIMNAFLSDDWKEAPLPKREYVLSKIYETSQSDLYFTRESREGEEENWVFRTAIHVSDDAQVICQYCEVGW